MLSLEGAKENFNVIPSNIKSLKISKPSQHTYTVQKIPFFNRVFHCFVIYFFQHCFICRPSNFTVSEYAAWLEPRTVAALALAVRHSNLSTRCHPHSTRCHPHSARSHPHSARCHPHSARCHPYSARSHSRSRLDLIYFNFKDLEKLGINLLSLSL